MAAPVTSSEGLMRENEALRAKLAEAEAKLAEAQDVIRAIRTGDVDAVIVSGPEGEQVFTLVEEALRRRSDLMRLSFDAIIVWRLGGSIESWNRGAEELYGYSESEALGRVTHELLKTVFPVPWANIEASLLESGQWEGELRHFTREGREVVVSTRKQLIRGADGIERVLETNRDITQRKKSEQALLRSEKLASVGRMAATIAHEVNNPLEAVMSLLFLAKGSEELSETTRQYLEMADGELKRIAYITRQSLGFYRESNGPAPTSVKAVLESTVDLLKSRIKAKRAVIEKQWDVDVKITAVAGELRQVFSNILSNSLDAIDAKGTIKVRVSNSRRYVRVTVADNGKGVSASSRQHIFEPFFTTKGTVGTGLGLWVSKQIIDKHGGTIRMRSSNNGAHSGTVFSVVLPIEAAAEVSS